MREDVWSLFDFFMVFSESKPIRSSGTKLWESEQGQFFFSEGILVCASVVPTAGSFAC